MYIAEARRGEGLAGGFSSEFGIFERPPGLANLCSGNWMIQILETKVEVNRSLFIENLCLSAVLM
jgi:hypothetical protein